MGMAEAREQAVGCSQCETEAQEADHQKMQPQQEVNSEEEVR